MFGYIAASVENLSEEEKERYHALYCGLCHTLKERHGQRSRACLTYDFTFLIMLFGSLYEPAEDAGASRCVVHPLKSHPYVHSTYTDYAADLTVMLAYHKCLDDWHDDHKVSARGFGQLLEKPYRVACGAWPRQARAIEDGLARIGEIEAADDAPPDAAANFFGRLMGELFVLADDPWEADLRHLGAQLGRFIYLMDAAVDYDDDREHGSYNPFVRMESTPEDMFAVLSNIAGAAAEAFEKLPLEQDLHLMRSVLYAGMWREFNVKYNSRNDDTSDSVEANADEGAILDPEHESAHDASAPTSLTAQKESHEQKSL